MRRQLWRNLTAILSLITQRQQRHPLLQFCNVLCTCNVWRAGVRCPGILWPKKRKRRNALIYPRALCAYAIVACGSDSTVILFFCLTGFVTKP